MTSHRRRVQGWVRGWDALLLTSPHHHPHQTTSPIHLTAYFRSSSTSTVSTRLVDLEDDRNGHKTEDEEDGLAGPAAYLRAIGGGT